MPGTGTESVGVYGAPISTLLCDLTVTCMNLRFLGMAIPKSRRSKGVGQTYYKPLAASLWAILSSIAVYLPLYHANVGMVVSLFAAIFVAGVTYAVFAVVLKIITSEDVAMLPMGEKILSRWRARSMDKIKNQKEKDVKNYDDQRKNSNVDDKNTI